MTDLACRICAARRRIALELFPNRRPLYIPCDNCKQVAKEYRAQVLWQFMVGLLGVGGAVAITAAFLLAAYGIVGRIMHHWGLYR